MRTSVIVTLALFGAFLLIVFVWLVSQDGPTDFVEAQTKFTTLRQAVALFLVAASGLFLLVRAVAGDAPGRLLGLVLPAFVGALLLEPSWSVAIGLAAATVGLALRPMLGGYNRRIPPTPAPDVTPVL